MLNLHISTHATHAARPSYDHPVITCLASRDVSKRSDLQNAPSSDTARASTSIDPSHVSHSPLYIHVIYNQQTPRRRVARPLLAWMAGVTVGGARKVVVLAWHVVVPACTGDRRMLQVRLRGSRSEPPVQVPSIPEQEPLHIRRSTGPDPELQVRFMFGPGSRGSRTGPWPVYSVQRTTYCQQANSALVWYPAVPQRPPSPSPLAS